MGQQDTGDAKRMRQSTTLWAALASIGYAIARQYAPEALPEVDGDTAMVIGGLIAGGLRFKSKRPVQTPRLGRAPMVRSLLFVLGLASATVLLA